MAAFKFSQGCNWETRPCCQFLHRPAEAFALGPALRCGERIGRFWLGQPPRGPNPALQDFALQALPFDAVALAHSRTCPDAVGVSIGTDATAGNKPNEFATSW